MGTPRSHHHQNKWTCLVAHLTALMVASMMYANWTPFNTYLKSQGVYQWKCDVGSDCIERDTALACLPIYALSASFSCAILGGVIRDMFGSKATYRVGTSFIVASMLIVGFNANGTNQPKLDLLPIAFLIWGASSEMITISVIGVQELFPQQKSLILTIISAIRSVSILTPNLIQYGNPNLQVFAFAYAAICFIWEIVFVRSNWFVHDSFSPRFDHGLEEIEHHESCLSYIRKRKYLSLALYYMCFITLFNYIVALMPIVYKDSPKMQSAVGLVIPLSGILGAPLLGAVADYTSPMAIPLSETISAGSILAACLVPHSFLGRVVMICTLLFYYACPAGQVYILVCQSYPTASHGSICGLTFLCGGVCSIMSSSLIKYVNHNLDLNNFFLTKVHTFMVVLLGGLFMVVSFEHRAKPPKDREDEHCTDLLSESDILSLNEALPRFDYNQCKNESMLV